MLKFLIDENLSPSLSNYLGNLKYNSRAVREVGLKGKSDEELIRWIRRNKRVLITADLDFGEFFYSKTLGEIGVIILKSRSQKLEDFIEIIDYLHREKVLRNKKLENSLVIATEGRYRLRRYI